MSKKMKLLLVVVMAFSLVLIGVGCGGGEDEELIIAVDTMFVPFSYEEGGEMVGFDVDLLKEITDRLGLSYEIQTMEFAGIIPALISDSVDMGFAGITITEDRKKEVDFSDSYYDSGLLIMVREDNNDIQGVEDLAGKRISTRHATSSYDFLIALDYVDESDIVSLDNMDGAYFELLSGEVDAALWDAPAQQYYYNTEGEGQVKLVGDLLDGQQYGIGFPKGSELRDQVNEVMDDMREDGTYGEIYKTWFGEYPR